MYLCGMKYKRKQQEIICNNCKITFLKDSSEVKRNLQRGMNNYCSKTCASSAPEKLALLAKVRPKNVLLKGYDRTDEFTLFRPHLRRAKYRKHFCNLTLEEMKEVWDNQKGICVYSKVELNKTNYKEKNNPIYTISLDRIDSNIGYTKNNIQFISVAMNFLKNSMTHEQMLEIIKIIKKE